MHTSVPASGLIHLLHAQETIKLILTQRLVQRQNGDLRRAFNAHIFLEFIQQVQACSNECYKRKRIKKSIFRWRISARSQRHFEERLCRLRQNVDSFAMELYARASKTEIGEGDERYRTFKQFSDAFDGNVRAVLEGTDAKKNNKDTASRKLGAVFLGIWTAAHV